MVALKYIQYFELWFRMEFLPGYVEIEKAQGKNNITARIKNLKPLKVNIYGEWTTFWRSLDPAIRCSFIFIGFRFQRKN